MRYIVVKVSYKILSWGGGGGGEISKGFSHSVKPVFTMLYFSLFSPFPSATLLFLLPFPSLPSPLPLFPYFLSIPLSFPSLPFPSLPFPSLPFPSLPFPSLPFPSLPFPSLPFPSLPFPSLPFPSLPFPFSFLPSHNSSPSISRTFTTTVGGSPESGRITRGPAPGERTRKLETLATVFSDLTTSTYSVQI